MICPLSSGPCHRHVEKQNFDPGNYELKVSYLKLQHLLKKDMTYFTILTACCRNPAKQAGLDKTLKGENAEFFIFFFKNQDTFGLLLYVLYIRETDSS